MTEGNPTISCAFNTENALFHAYMPFVKNGGLFIRTKSTYELGSEVNLKVCLLNDPEEYIVDGKVVWISPKGVQGNKPTGVGVEFTGKNKRNLCNKIETYLTGRLKSTEPTDTM